MRLSKVSTRSKLYLNKNSIRRDGQARIPCQCKFHTGDLCHPIFPLPDNHVSEDIARFKYIDDLAEAEAVKLSDLVPITSEMPRPLEYRDRTLHELPNERSTLQKILLQIDEYCTIQQMKINSSKTKTAVFHTAILKDFKPRLVNSEGQVYENTESFKLLGVEFVTNSKSGLKWDTYIEKCIKKAYCRMWILKRLSESGVSTEDLLMTYCMRIRISVEMNIPLWTFSISKALSIKIEKIQRIATFIILGREAHKDYYCNLAILDLLPLENRRENIANKFAHKISKHPIHKNIFQTSEANTRSGKHIVIPKTRTSRYENSSIPSLAKILNNPSAK